MKRLIPFIAIIVFLLSGCEGYKLPTQKIVIETAEKQIKLTVEVADSAQERSEGYMFREKIKDGSGMWFVFEDEVPRYFWMKNTPVPLDVIFFNSQKEVVSIIENMQPCKEEDCFMYDSIRPAMYALEVPAGFVKANKIKTGDKANIYGNSFNK